jgi:glycosyltransferase involved in cell wall biosynthesis
MKDYKEPLVSIITPSFNQGSFIEETILSILGQTYQNIEFIIVDGGSTDNTMAIVNKYSNEIDIIIHESDEGQADAINKGFKLAKGELVGWINSDDIIYPECIEKIVELYNNHPEGAVFYHSLLDWINDKNQIISKRIVEIPNRDHLLNINSTIIQIGSFYPLELVKRINFLDKTIYYCMDLDLWLRLLSHGNIYYTSGQAYSAFRMYPGTKTDTGKFDFLRNIKDTLLLNGAKWYSRNILIGYYLYKIKLFIKSF